MSLLYTRRIPKINRNYIPHLLSPPPQHEPLFLTFLSVLGLVHLLVVHLLVAF
jgi:hypothetical protein